MNDHAHSINPAEVLTHRPASTHAKQLPSAITPHQATKLEKVSLRRTNWNWQKRPGADLADADLAESQMIAVCLARSNLRAANLSQTNLSGSDLEKANLRQANLSYACLIWANLRQADLRHANLTAADLRWADLRQADLKNAVLAGAKWNAQTLWPAGFVFEKHKAVAVPDTH